MERDGKGRKGKGRMQNSMKKNKRDEKGRDAHDDGYAIHIISTTYTSYTIIHITSASNTHIIDIK